MTVSRTQDTKSSRARLVMAPSVRLVLLLTVLLSLGETPASVPVHQGRGGWTLNSVGYLLGPVLHLPQSTDHGGKEKTALEVLHLWKAVDGLPYPRPQRASKRSLRETFAQAETADLGKLSNKAPKEGDARGLRCLQTSALHPSPQLLLNPCLAPSTETEILKSSL
ncbi:galanin-like peptide [Zalophus californianus]|uniref:Galanin-like peptide n=1 Tax=Zalophus californianus TaxID=9704 RepID=A0A6J2F3J3_ZALCA|nr:galanin-like peptide [Zalophus californianus]